MDERQGRRAFLAGLAAAGVVSLGGVARGAETASGAACSWLGDQNANDYGLFDLAELGGDGLTEGDDLVSLVGPNLSINADGKLEASGNVTSSDLLDIEEDGGTVVTDADVLNFTTGMTASNPSGSQVDAGLDDPLTNVQIGESGTRDDAFFAAADIDDVTINNVAAKGISNSAQSIPDSSNTTVELDVADFEDDSSLIEVDTTNDQLVIKQAGVYLIQGTVLYSGSFSDGDLSLARLDLDGTRLTEERNVPGGSMSPGHSLSDLIEVTSPNVNISMVLFQTTGGSVDIESDEQVAVSAARLG
jgi:hypothetical protein